jgi:hypothetical protein
VPRLFTYPTDNKSPAVQAVLNKNLEALSSVSLSELQQLQGRSDQNVPVSALHLAVQQNDAQVMSVLFKRKPDWNTPDQFHRTPLYFAIQSGFNELALKLIENGADPNKAATSGITPFDIAVAFYPDLASKMISRNFQPDSQLAMLIAISRGNEPLIKQLMPFTKKKEVLLRSSADFGKENLVRYFLAQGVDTGDATADELLKVARENVEASASFARNFSARPLAGKPKPVAKSQLGTFFLVPKEWAPGIPLPEGDEVESPRHNDPSNFPVSMYVPKSYTGNEPYGLMVFMHGRRGNGHSYPNAAYQKILDKHHIIWAGYSAYISNASAGFLNKFTAAVAHNVMTQFNIDPKRVYMAGISWGGRVTAGYAPLRPDLFSGAIAMGGAFQSGIAPSLDVAKENMTLVFSAGDYDFNRKEAFSRYTGYQTLGFKNVHYLQEPSGGHEILSPSLFEKAVQMIDK